MNATQWLGLALSVAAPTLKDPPKKEAEVVGEWQVESLVIGGKVIEQPAGAPVRYSFTKDGKWVISRSGKEVGGKGRAYKTDPKADPPTIDLLSEPGNPDGPFNLGIYAIQGDTLTLCMSTANLARPTKFEPAGAPRVATYVFKRVKQD